MSLTCISGAVRVETEEGRDYQSRIIRFAEGEEQVKKRVKRVWANMKKRFPGETIVVSVYSLHESNISKLDGSLLYSEDFYSMQSINYWFGK